jgi:site-specific recombinase XerC
MQRARDEPADAGAVVGRSAVPARLPKTLDGAQVNAVLATYDRRATVGRRNHAALLLMVRLGLRAGEVAALTLDDIAWDVGEVTIRGKGSTQGRLPLPTDVGNAIVAYLRHRRRGTPSRSLFLQSRAPYRDATAGNCQGDRLVCATCSRNHLGANC